MGRKTYESIGRPLPGRENIIITRNPDFQAPGGLIIHSLSKAIELARKQGDDEVFVIGGAEIFTNFIDIADRLYLTIVHTSAVVDTFFPEFNPNKWVAIFTEFIPAGEANKYATTFMIYERK
jgi:dihydrofolate reductase